MDTYQKVLVKLFEETGGRETRQVDFASMLKKMGFYTAFNDILMRLNREGWITDAPTTNYVYITHWGAMEAKKALRNEIKPETSNEAIKKEVNRAVASSKELVITLEEFSNEISKENYTNAEKKFDELATILGEIKSNL
jgi:pantothenate kinase-related protein Tda10